MRAVCRHCLQPIESFNSYDYVTHGPSWKHRNTDSMWCQRTMAAPESDARVLVPVDETKESW